MADGIPVPTPEVAVALGSVARHVQEILSPAGHPFDRVAVEGLMANPAVQEYLEELDALALLPVPREHPQLRGGSR